MKHIYKTWGVCSRQMEFSLDEEGRIRELTIAGGCNGNLQGLSALVEGQPADEVIKRLEGIRCDAKQTSCPDQLSRALREALQRQKEEQ